VTSFDQQAEVLRATHSDFDAVVNELPLTPAMRDAVLSSSQTGAALAYHLAKHPAVYQEIAAQPYAKALITLGRIEASLTAAPKESAKPVTKAPAVPTQTVGPTASATEPDTRKGVPLKDHIRIEEAEIAERRRQGYRY
jgi:hypothetical protein